MTTRRTSPAGIRLITTAESFSAVVYICPAGKPTVGYGHVVRAHDDLHPPISPARALALLYEDLAPIEIYLDAIFPTLSQGQFDALSSFCMNVGLGNFEHSTLFSCLKAADVLGAADEFRRWDKATDPKTHAKIVLPGLTKRRAAERALFLTPDTTPAPTH